MSSPAGFHRYWAYGLGIASEVPLGPLLPADNEHQAPVVTMSLGIPPGDRTDTDVEFGFPDGCRVLVRGGREAYFEPAAGMSQSLIAEYLSSPVLAVLMEQRGAFVLHASAVEIDGRVVAFTGPSGAGKSTTAGFFAARGFPVVTDDLLPLTVVGSQVLCRAGPEALKLIKGGAIALPGLAVAAELTDKQLRVPARARGTAERQELVAVYVVEDADAVSTRPLRGQRAIAALLESAFCLGVVGPGRRADHLVRCGAIAGRLPVREVLRPRTWECAERVVELVVAEATAVEGARSSA
jgi:hypothetical protein